MKDKKFQIGVILAVLAVGFLALGFNAEFLTQAVRGVSQQSLQPSREPLRVSNIISVQSSLLRPQALTFHAVQTGRLLGTLRANNTFAGNTQSGSTTPSAIYISLPANTNSQAQELSIKTGNGDIKVFLPSTIVNRLSKTRSDPRIQFYVATDGSTYYRDLRHDGSGAILSYAQAMNPTRQQARQVTAHLARAGRAIQITAPNGGETLTAGQNVTVKWKHLNVGTVQFDLYDTENNSYFGDASWTTSASRGEFTFQIPTTFPPTFSRYGSGFKMYIVSQESPSVSDMSDNTLTISPPPPLTVVTPNGDERWEINNSEVISWTPNEDNPNMEAYLETKTGSNTYNTIGQIIPDGRGSIIWGGAIDIHRPSNAEPGDGYYVRIVDKVTGASDRSDNPFTLLKKGETIGTILQAVDGKRATDTLYDRPAVTLSSDRVGKNIDISWSSRGSSCTVLVYSGHETEKRSIAENMPGTGLTSLGLPESDTDYYIASVNCTGTVNGHNYSGDEFVYIKINRSPVPEITIISPNGGEEFTLGIDKESDFAVLWNHKDLKGDVSVYIRLEDGSTCFIAKVPVERNGLYTKLGVNYRCPNIPKNITTGDKYEVGIYADNGDSSVDFVAKDRSDNYFTIISSVQTSNSKLIISRASDSPTGGVVSVDDADDTDNVTLLKGTLKADGSSDLYLRNLPVSLTTTADSLSAVVNGLTLKINNEEYSESVTIPNDYRGVIVFDDIDFNIAAGTTVYFTVSADINDVENTGVTATDFDSGDTLKASVLDSDHASFDVQGENGAKLSASSIVGTAIGSAQEFRSEGVLLVSFLSSDASVSVAEGDKNDVGTFIIKFRAQAADGNVYLPGRVYMHGNTSPQSSKTTIRVDRSGEDTIVDTSMLRTWTTNNGASQTSTGNILLEDGESSDITITITITLPEQGTAGAHRVSLTGIGWGTTDIDPPVNTYNGNLGSFVTNYIDLN